MRRREGRGKKEGGRGRERERERDKRAGTGREVAMPLDGAKDNPIKTNPELEHFSSLKILFKFFSEFSKRDSMNLAENYEETDLHTCSAFRNLFHNGSQNAGRELT